MKFLKKKTLKSTNGITLIALVITIIVLLILAGISISMLSGDNSILQKATTAKENTERTEIIENAKLDVLAEITDNKGGNITKNQLAKVLNNYFKPTEASAIPDEISSMHDLPLTTTDEKYTINLSEIYNGKFVSENVINWNDIFASATQNPERYKHSEQTTDTRIAFGPSGKSVNLDLWNVAGDDNGYILQGTRSSGPFGQPIYSPGYLGQITSDGKLKSEIPMYIQSANDSDKFIPVIKLEYTFAGIYDLVYGPEIPNTVKILQYTFQTSDLEEITIPDSVTSMDDSGTFKSCKELTIGSGLENISNQAIYHLENITKIKVSKDNKKYDSRDNCNAIIETNSNKIIIGCKNTIIPTSVTTIGECSFMGCSTLTDITIPSSITTIEPTAFQNCTGLTNITIPNSVRTVGKFAFNYWTNSQTINIQFKESELPNGWNSDWNKYCNAQINYLQ